MKIPEACRDSGFQTGVIWGLGYGLFLVFLPAILCVLDENPNEPPMKPANRIRTNAVKDHCGHGQDLSVRQLGDTHSLFLVHDGIPKAPEIGGIKVRQPQKAQRGPNEQ